MKRATLGALVFLVSVGVVASESSAQVLTVEYIAHAAVIIESGPTRILIDPYNGSRWMGYTFPDDLDVDAVLVTHPHYDHDASYYAGEGVPVFTEPGRFRVGDVELIGVDSEHSGGDRFRQRGATPWNVIWTVVAEGRRFTHVGDNRVLNGADLQALGSTDVLFVPPFHPRADALAEAQQLGAELLVPVHYRIPEMAAEGYGMPTVEDWLDGATAVRRRSHRLDLDIRTGGVQPEILVLDPHPDVMPWRPDLAAAWVLSREAAAASAADEGGLAVEKLIAAISLGPEVMTFPLDLGSILTALGRGEEAIAVWEAALTRAKNGDREPVLRIKGALVSAYNAAGRSEEAAALIGEIQTSGRTYAVDVVRGIGGSWEP